MFVVQFCSNHSLPLIRPNSAARWKTTSGSLAVEDALELAMFAHVSTRRRDRPAVVEVDAADLMAVLDQLRDEGPTQRSLAAGDQDLHAGMPPRRRLSSPPRFMRRKLKRWSLLGSLAPMGAGR